MRERPTFPVSSSGSVSVYLSFAVSPHINIRMLASLFFYFVFYWLTLILIHDDGVQCDKLVHVYNVSDQISKVCVEKLRILF